MKKSGYREFMENKNFLLYLTANIINRFGDSLDSIAFTWIIYTITGSAFWSALIFGINRLPTILLQPFLGVLVDKLNKKKNINYIRYHSWYLCFDNCSGYISRMVE